MTLNINHKCKMFFERKTIMNLHKISGFKETNLVKKLPKTFSSLELEWNKNRTTTELQF